MFEEIARQGRKVVAMLTGGQFIRVDPDTLRTEVLMDGERLVSFTERGQKGVDYSPGFLTDVVVVESHVAAVWLAPTEES